MRRSGWLERDLIGDTSGHEGVTRLWLASAARTAIRDPRIAVIAVLAVAAWLMGLSGCLVVIPVVYALRIALGLRDGHAQQETRREARTRAIDLPYALSFSDDGARHLIERLERARWATESAVLAGPGGAAFSVGGLIGDIPQLERDVVILAARIEYLGRFLSTGPSNGLRPEILYLDRERDKETDPAAREGLDRLLGRCQEHLGTLNALERRRSTTLRTANELLRTLEQIPARIVSLQLARADCCDGHTADSTQRAVAMVEGFAALEQTTASTAGTGGERVD